MKRFTACENTENAHHMSEARRKPARFFHSLTPSRCIPVVSQPVSHFTMGCYVSISRPPTMPAKRLYSAAPIAPNTKPIAP